MINMKSKKMIFIMVAISTLLLTGAGYQFARLLNGDDVLAVVGRPISKQQSGLNDYAHKVTAVTTAPITFVDPDLPYVSPSQSHDLPYYRNARVAQNAFLTNYGPDEVCFAGFESINSTPCSSVCSASGLTCDKTPTDGSPVFPMSQRELPRYSGEYCLCVVSFGTSTVHAERVARGN
jgi:hypothetical protein